MAQARTSARVSFHNFAMLEDCRMGNPGERGSGAVA